MFVGLAWPFQPTVGWWKEHTLVDERDEWIARSKAILNLHSYERPLFEAVRISYLLNNRCAVFSESSEGGAYEGIPSLIISESEIDHLKVVLEDTGQLRAIAEQEAKRFREDFLMTEILKRSINFAVL